MHAAVADALAFIDTHGVVLASAKGPAPRLIDAIAGEAIAGNWWIHPRAGEIYRNNGGRGFYFDSPDGHLLEVLTRPYASDA